MKKRRVSSYNVPTKRVSTRGEFRSIVAHGNVLKRYNVHVSKGCLIVMLPADLETDVAKDLEVLLEDINHQHYRGLVMDLSLVDILPSKIATILTQLAWATKLLHSPMVICGIKPALASALALLDIQIQDVQKARDLDHALALLTEKQAVNGMGRQYECTPPDKPERHR